jgi:hypothetical protein
VSLLHAIVLLAVLGAVLLICAYRLKRLRVARFARRVTQGSASQRDAVFSLGRVIFAEVKRRNKDPAFITPILAPLGASPTTILKKGGCCSGVNRLFITALDTIDIRAVNITVYRRADPAAAHCLAQVSVAGEEILIDVDYGVWLRRPDGGPLDLSGLRAGLVPAIEPFVRDQRASYADSARTRPAGYPDREYYRFDYGVTRTANWAESALKRTVYAVLHPLTRGRVDFLKLPPILEWPEVLLAFALCFATVLLLTAGTLAQA